MKKTKSHIKNYLKQANDDGFSLLELVIAVGVLLVLSAVGLLAYNGITRNARMAAVQSAADEVYTGAAAYDANGDDYTQAEKDWMETSKKDTANSITVEVKDKEETNGKLCVVAYMEKHTGIIAKKGSGCETGGVVSPGDETTPPPPVVGGETEIPVIDDPEDSGSDDSNVNKTFYADVEINFDPGYDSYYTLLYKDSQENVLFNEYVDPLYSINIVYEGDLWEKVDDKWMPVIYYSIDGYMWWDTKDIKAILECDVEEDETSVYAYCAHNLSKDNKDNPAPTPTPTPVCEYTSEEAKIRAEEIYNETLPKAINMVKNNTIKHVDGKATVLPGDEQNYTRKASDENCGIDITIARIVSTNGETYAFSDQSNRYAYMFVVQIDTDEKIANSSASYRHNHVGLINVKNSYEDSIKASALKYNSPDGTTWGGNNKL